MAIKAKGKGKSGGARLIAFNVLTDVENGQVVFLLLYDKEDASTVKVNVVKQMVCDMEFEILFCFFPYIFFLLTKLSNLAGKDFL